MSTAKRQTQQKTAIVDAIEGIDCAFTPQELLEQAQRHCPGLGIATVYRSIRDQVAKGRVRRVVIADGAPRYERTNVAHHHHFHCESCGEVTPLEGCSLKESYQLPPGFKVSSHEITFTGACPACAEPGSET
jgi:Fur family ferric uptake transcriptional regulator